MNKKLELMNCIVIEDQPPAQRILKKYIVEVDTLSLQGVFTDAISAMNILKEGHIDLIFLDIHLPKLSGIEFLKSLPTSAHVILTTAFPDYALESYELNVVDYLLKPFSFQRFVTAVSKVLVQNATDRNLASNSKKEIFVKSGYDIVKVDVAKIIIIKSDSDYTSLVLVDNEYLSSESLKYWEEEFQENVFVRVHKSYIVNIDMLLKISGNRIILKYGLEVPIGRAFKDNLFNRIRYLK
ncbi:MAG: LytTR family DNA-binding domain-containing protein [Chitinophagales bacterium]